MKLGEERILIKILMLMMIVIASSCVSTRPASTLKRAENRVIKLNEGLDNQVSRYPELISKVRRRVVLQEVPLPIDSLRLNLLLQDIVFLRSLNSQMMETTVRMNMTIDSLMNMPIQDYPEECEFIVADLRSRINRLGSSLKVMNADRDRLQQLYTEASLIRQDGTYTDDRFIVDYLYEEGQLQFNVRTREGFIVVEKEIHEYDIDIRKHFWQDWKFYIFFITMVGIFYMFGDILFRVIGKLISSIRKLFVGI